MQETRKRELKRVRKRLKTRQGKFESSFVSLDAILAKHGDHSRIVSDRGAGARAVYANADGLTIESIRARRLNTARKRLSRHHPELLDVFNLIVKNGSNRKESIWWLMSRKLGTGLPQKSSTGDT